MKLYFPLIQTEFLMSCRVRMPFGLIEKYICRCIEEGICTQSEIQQLLNLTDEEYLETVHTLIKERMIKEKEGQLSLLYDTNTEWKNFKYLAYQKRKVIWCYLGLLNAEQKIATQSKVLPHTVKIETVLEDKDAYFLLPKVLLHFNAEELKALKPKMFIYKGMEKEDILEITNLEVLKERTIVYEPYEMQIDNDKVSIYKSIDEAQTNPAIHLTLQKFYDQGKLFSLMHKVE